MNIYMLWSTVRPKMFLDTYNYWMSKNSNKFNIYLKVAVSNDIDKSLIESYKLPNCDVIVANNGTIGVVYPTYCLTRDLLADDDDIIILCSDDFFPPNHWDIYLEDQLRHFNGCLFVNEGYQNPLVINDRTSITIPIMTFDCLRRLNKAIYHPSYIHMFSDTELYFNVRDLKLLKDNRIDDKTLFEHRHFVVEKRQKDEFDSQYNKNWDKDHENYIKRMKLDVLDRIKIEV